MNDLPDILPIDIPERDITLYLPLTLNKLDERQYIAFFGLLFRMENKEIDYADFAVLCVYELLNIKKGNRKREESEITEAMANIARLSEYISHFFTQQKNVLSLKLEYTQNHIPYVTVPFYKKYYGPSNHYYDVKFGEYEDGLNIFLQYSETPSREILQQLMATFYRPKLVGKRAGYTDIPASQLSKYFSNVQMGALYGFYYNFAAFHTYFSSSQVYYNGKLIDLSILFEDQPEDEKTQYQSPYPSLGIKSTGIEIAKTGVLGNLQEVRQTPLWEVALLLYDMRKKDLDQRAQTKQSQKTEK